MPLRYVQDDAGHRIKVTVTDPITARDLHAMVERQFAEGAWMYSMMVDARTLANPPTADDIRAILVRVLELTAVQGPRGPIAFVARQSAAISAAQKYVHFGGSQECFEVFWDLTEAEHWLVGQTASAATQLKS